MRILFIEDSERLQRSVGTGLRKAGYAVDAATSGTDGEWLAQSNTYDVILLDLMLPGMDGLTLLSRLREAGDKTPILMLTARGSVDDRVKGLQLGADDYLPKPFAFDELLARVQALVRRGHDQRSPVIVIGDMRIDTSARSVTRAGEPISLAAREYAILEYLAYRTGETVSRSEIEEHVYDDRAELMSNVVDSAICGLRKKLSRPGADPLIHTRRGMGYVLVAEP